MITREQVINELQYYISEFGMDYYIEIKNGKHFPVTAAYLLQQEIKDKLLELYQKRDKFSGYKETYKSITGEIKQLEEEMK